MPSSDPLEGRLLGGRYRLDAVLGRGGMGRVYRGTQIAPAPIERPVAIKLIREDRLGEAAARRFEREAATLASLQHPHIVAMLDYGDEELGDGRGRYLVMELLEGEPLSTVMEREGALDPERASALATQILRALDAAHSAGVVHRDLKPANVLLVDYGGDREFVKLVDFGIARDVGQASSLTGTEDIVGSPRYISPEQATAQPITAQSDLYAWGAVVYEMLTGRPVFSRASALDTVMAHAHDPAPPPTRDGVPLEGPLVDAAMACLQKLAWERPESARSLLEALEGRGSVAAPDPAPARRWRWMGGLASVAAVGVISAILALGVLVALAGEEAAPPEPSQEQQTPASVEPPSPPAAERPAPEPAPPEAPPATEEPAAPAEADAPEAEAKDEGEVEVEPEPARVVETKRRPPPRKKAEGAPEEPPVEAPKLDLDRIPVK